MTNPERQALDDPVNDDLVGRLEKASGPDRQIDREIAKAADPTIWKRATNWASMPCGAPTDIIERDAIRWVPAYTESLDAALALAERVLPGKEISMVHSPGGSFPYADVWVHKLSGQCHAKTPALALCIAILKARSSSGTGSNKGEGETDA